MLENTTFIVPLRIETQDRLNNIISICCYLLGNFKDTHVLVKEADEYPKFAEFALPHIQEKVKTDNLTFIFENIGEGGIFHRTRYLNDMLDLTTTPVVVNYDSDVLLPLESYVEAEKLCLAEHDLVYPYGFGDNVQQMVFLNEETLGRFINSLNLKDLQLPTNKLWRAENGFCQFFKTSSYRMGFMENEQFVSYGPEDSERAHRFKTLGYNVGRIDSPVYHLEHHRTFNSSPMNPYMKKNEALWKTLSTMNKEQLLSYYNALDYWKTRAR